MLGQTLLPCSAIDSKEFIHLRHDPDRALISGIDFERLEELSPGMRPARRVDDSGSADMIVSPRASPPYQVMGEGVAPVVPALS